MLEIFSPKSPRKAQMVPYEKAQNPDFWRTGSFEVMGGPPSLLFNCLLHLIVPSSMSSYNV